MEENYVSKLILGTVQFGCQYGINSVGRPTENQVRDILEVCKNFGIDRLDTSSAYGNSEVVLGKAIENKSFKLISKYPDCGLRISEQFSVTLNKLGISHLYGYLLHHFHLYKRDNNIWKEFIRLKEEGKVQNIGFSLYTHEELDQILHDGVPFDVIQIPYNLFDRSFEPYFELLCDKRVKIHVRSTFLQGLFFKDRNSLPSRLQPLKRYLVDLDSYSKETGLSIGEIALNHNIQNPYIDGVLIGVDNVEQLLQNIASVKGRHIEYKVDIKEKELLNPVNWK